MMTSIELTVSGIAMLTLVGCFSSGVQIDPQQLTGFQKGRTTYAEVVDRLGPPTTQTFDSSSGRTISYTYVESKARPETFVPIVGAFIGGADSKLNNVMFRFDENGTLIDYNGTFGQYGAGSGFESGTSVGRIPNQPRQAH